MSEISRTTVELRTARDNQSGAEAAATFFSSLPNIPSGLKGIFSRPEPIVVEWLNQGQTTYASLTCATDQLEYVSSQLVSNYPEVLIQSLDHNTLEEFSKPHPKEWGELVLAGPSYLPLRTYQDYASVDPLATVLSTLSKLQDQEAALIQFTLRKAPPKWKNQGNSVLHPAKKSSSSDDASNVLSGLGDTSQSGPHPHASLIQQKLADTGFEVAIAILTQAPTQERAKQIYESLSNAFNAFQSQANSLVSRKGFAFRQRKLDHILARTVPLRKLYLSSKELATMFHLPNQQLASVRGIAWGKNLRGEPPHNLPVWANLTEEEKENINIFARAEFKNQSQVFGIKKEDRRRHMYAVGKSGTGKSTLLANMIINDLKHDEGLAVVDPHGDLVETVLDYIPKRRINDVILFDPSDPVAVVKMNLFEGGSTIHRELVASGIVSIFQKLYGYTWGPRLEYVLRNALMTLLYHNAKLSDVLRILTDKKYRDRIVAATDDPVLRNFWEAEFNRLTDKQRTEAISPILNKVGQFVTSPLIRNVVDAQQSSFDIEEIMNQGKILLVNVSQGKIGEDNAALMGAMVITKIQLAAMNRVYMKEEDRRDFYLYIDEFQNFATTSFIKILSEARKYRLDLILANQYIDQIPPEVRSAIFGNAGNLVSFIVGATDGAILQQEFGGKYTAEDLVSLSRYQIITRLLIDGHISNPFPAQTLNLATSNNQNREKVIKVSRERYSKKS